MNGLQLMTWVFTQRGSHRCVNCFVQNKHRVGKQVTQCSCRRGPYLPTVPELTHMPLWGWFSRSLETGQSCTENWEGVAVVSLFVTESHRGTTADVARVFSALSHPHLLPASLIRRLSVLYKRRLAAAALTWHCCDRRRTLDRLKSTHYEHKDFPRLSHPSFFLLLFPQLISPGHASTTLRHDKSSVSSCAAFKYCQEQRRGWCGETYLSNIIGNFATATYLNIL